MKIKKLTVDLHAFPDRLKHIPSPPKQLFVRGSALSDILTRPTVTIVGSRKVTAYGRAVTAQLAGELARAGVVIISGLALGIDSLAHRAALEAGTPTVAVLPGSVEEIYPRSHHSLAQEIIRRGGALVSEYPAGSQIYKTSFIARNRIAAGLGDALLIIEAAEKSGTLHTARFALEQGRDVLAVPGNITSPTSAGTNNLLKTGATPVSGAADIFYALGVQPQTQTTQKVQGDTPDEQAILDLLAAGECDGAAMLAASQLEIQRFNQTLTMLEITGKVRALGADKWGLA